MELIDVRLLRYLSVNNYVEAICTIGIIFYTYFAQLAVSVDL